MNTILAISILFTQCGKKNSVPSNPALSASISNVSQDRAVTASVFHFAVSLSKPATTAVNIHYTTVAGTALATTDFLPVTGTLTISANQQQGLIDVTVTGDSL